MPKDQTLSTPDADFVHRMANEAGYRLLPLHPWDFKRTKTLKDGSTVEVDAGKTPVDARWTTRAYRTEDVLAHVRAGGNAGLQLTGRSLVVDVDPRAFPSGETLDTENPFGRLCGEAGLDPEAFTRTLTGSGGLHLHMTKPEDVAIVGSLKDFPGVEFKTRGQQVVAPGSVHPNGCAYRLLPDWMGDVGCEPAPDALLELIARPSVGKTSANDVHLEPAEVARVLDAIGDVDGYDDWLAVLMACHKVSGGFALKECQAWSWDGDEETVARKWSGFDAGRAEGSVGWGTLKRICRGNGGELSVLDDLERGDPAEQFVDDLPDNPRLPAATNRTELASRRGRGLKLVGRGNDMRADSKSFENALIAAENMPCVPRWNEFKEVVEFEGDLPWGEEYGRELTDHVRRLVREFFMVQHSQWAYEPSSEAVFEALMTAAYKRKFHPVRDYLDGLTWNGVPRARRLFADGFGCADDAYTEEVSKAFLLGAVARARKPGWKVDAMPVISGPQGTGKSTGFRVLAGDDWFSDSELGDMKGKDAAINLRGTWVQEIAELDKMSNADVSTMKAFMSRAVDKYRSPYDRVAGEHPRQTVFVGTVNDDGYLRDDTGNRRYWPLEQRAGSTVDLDWIAASRDQLWAEADALLSAGETTNLPREMWSEAGERQERQLTLDPWQEAIQTFIELRERGEVEEVWDEDGKEVLDPPPADRFHSWELFEHLGFGVDKANKAQAQRVRRLMGRFPEWEYRRAVRIDDENRVGYVRKGD